MGFLLVTAVLVVTFGRLGDQYGRAKLFNLGFLIFTIGSVGCALVPNSGCGRRARDHRAARRPGRRRRDDHGQLDGDHHRRVPARPARLRARRQPGRRRWPARSSAWSSAACSRSGTGARCSGSACRSASGAPGWATAPCTTSRATQPRGVVIDWWGNLTFGIGLIALLVGITYGLQPYGGHTMGWTSPRVLAGADRRRRRCSSRSASSRTASPTR